MVGGKVSILTARDGADLLDHYGLRYRNYFSYNHGRHAVTTKHGGCGSFGGAVDFPLVEPIVAGFATMNGAYRPKEGQPQEPPEKTSRPFSVNRRGFVVSEGAGCVIMATEEFAKAHGLKIKNRIGRMFNDIGCQPFCFA